MRAALVLVAGVLAGCASTPASQTPHGSTSQAGDILPEPSILVTEAMGSPRVGDAAPPLELPDQDGHPVSLASLRGSVVLLAFVASFCPFSEAEQPYLKALAEEYRGKNVKVLAVDVKEDDAAYRKYMTRVAMPFPVLRDRTGEATASWAPPGAQPALTDRSMVLVTSNIVLDREGTIRFYTLVDTVHFDAKLVHARRAIDRLLADGGA